MWTQVNNRDILPFPPVSTLLMSTSSSEGKIDQHTLYKGEGQAKTPPCPPLLFLFLLRLLGTHLYLHYRRNLVKCVPVHLTKEFHGGCLHLYSLLSTKCILKPKCLNCSPNFPVHYTLGLKGPLVSISDNMPVRELSCLSKLVCFSVNLWWRKNGDHRNKFNIHKLGNHDEAKRMDGWVRSWRGYFVTDYKNTTKTSNMDILKKKIM